MTKSNCINEETLEQEMRSWVEQQIRRQHERIQRSGQPASELEERYEVDLQNLSGNDLFYVFQNNFWLALKIASLYFDNNGVVRPEHASSGQTIKAFHLSEVHQSILELGYNLQTIRDLGGPVGSNRKLTNEELAIVKAVFLKMRTRGYSHRELRG